MADQDPTMNRAASRRDQIAGVIIGTAVGDALELPREGLSRKRARKLFGPPPLRHSFFFGRGMVSDDANGNDLVLFSSDQRLLRAAQAEGLLTFNPETQDQLVLGITSSSLYGSSENQVFSRGLLPARAEARG